MVVIIASKSKGGVWRSQRYRVLGGK
jgi:hypothetical protein